jgi:hypothetical protein
MKLLLACFFLALILSGCGGIPLRSMPRLIKLQEELLAANPAEFMIAIQIDARMTPPPGAAPVLHLTIRPNESGGFDAIDKKLPMRFTVASANSLGLAAPPAHRRWLIYSFPAESQAELVQIQHSFKGIQARHGEKGGGSIAIGIAQEGVAARDPAFADTRWESWLQTSRRDGFFELWSGTVGELLKSAEAAAT